MWMLPESISSFLDMVNCKLWSLGSSRALEVIRHKRTMRGMLLTVEFTWWKEQPLFSGNFWGETLCPSCYSQFYVEYVAPYVVIDVYVFRCNVILSILSSYSEGSSLYACHVSDECTSQNMGIYS